jgi:hypothetical protein
MIKYITPGKWDELYISAYLLVGIYDNNQKGRDVLNYGLLKFRLTFFFTTFMKNECTAGKGVFPYNKPATSRPVLISSPSLAPAAAKARIHQGPTCNDPASSSLPTAAALLCA